MGRERRGERREDVCGGRRRYPVSILVISLFMINVKRPPSKGTPSFRFHSCTHGLFEELGRHAKKSRSQECPDCEACNKESVEHIPFECSSYDSQRQNFLDYMYLKQVLAPKASEVLFKRSSIFDKAVFCLAEKQGMLMSDECRSWYNRGGDFLISVWNGRKRNFVRQWTII